MAKFSQRNMRCSLKRKLVAASGILLTSALLGVPPAWCGTINYSYDTLGRVIAVSYADGSTIGYSYDAAGNRTQVLRTRVNGTPVANTDAATVAYGGSVTIDPRLNDTDPDNNALTVTGVGAAAHGTTSFTATSVTYTPTTSYYGADSFTYTISDGNGGAATGTVNVTVGTPSAPTVSNKSLSVAYNTTGTVGLAPSGVYNSLSIPSAPAHGTASISGATATYTPAAGYYGSDSFTFTASGPGGTSAPATVSVSVSTPAAPTVGNGSLSVAYNTSGSVGLSPSGVYSSLSVASNPAHGSASISGATATYTPTAGYYGSDSFTYSATGPGGTSAPATISISVSSPNIPVVGNVSMSTNYNTANSVGLAPSGVYTSLAVASGPAHGSASISGTTATYSPTAGYYGSDSFTYTATGPGGTSAPATVSVTVNTPAVPTAGNVSMSTNYNTANSVGLAPSGVYTSLAVASGPAHGSASISGTTATYSPTAGYYGSDSFTYTATGPGGTSAPATVSVTVNTPAVPTAGNVSMSTNYNTANSVGLAPSGIYTSLAVASGPAHGSASISGTTATYTPTAGYSGADSFSYTVTGPGGTSSPAIVTVTVQPNPIVTLNVTTASNLRTLADNNGYGGAATAQYQFVVPAGTTISGTAAVASSAGNAIDTGTWPAGVALTLVVSGNVYGGGGKGGNGSNIGTALPGTAGGDAIYVQAPITIVVNSGGSIKGGGGGGGGGAAASGVPATKKYAGSGGGGGFPNGSGGLGGVSPTGIDGNPGTAGTVTGGGTGGTASGGSGGNGGGSGSAGTAGGGAGTFNGGAAGQAGYAIRKNGQVVTVTNNGTITGTQQ